MTKNNPIDIESQIKVVAAEGVLPELDLLALSPPLDQALASIEDNIVEDKKKDE